MGTLMPQDIASVIAESLREKLNKDDRITLERATIELKTFEGDIFQIHVALRRRAETDDAA